jgi:hypothetical protein
MKRRDRQIFVLDVADEPAFAFEAESARAAEALAQSPWFVRALGDFCAKRRTALSASAAISTRMATDSEVALYRERTAEFIDATDRILFTHITKALNWPWGFPKSSFDVPARPNAGSAVSHNRARLTTNASARTMRR